MLDVGTLSGVETLVELSFRHACDHQDYTRTVWMPTEIASDFTSAASCGADGATMLIMSRCLNETYVPDKIEVML